MGFLRYIIQGAGWEVGRQAASEGLDKLREAHDEDESDDATATARTAPPAPPRVTERDVKRQRAEIERQLRELKKKAQQK